jgi:CheY-like chemotaxis protein
MIPQQLTIVLAEDDEGHATLVQRNLRRAGIANDMVHLKDGQEALDYIHCQGRFSDRALDGSLLILLDINMPRVNGVEVLHRLKTDQKTAKLPVIILTTTDDPREVERCYQLGCSVYVTKPVAYEEFVEAIRRLGLFLSIVKAPREAE